MKRLIPLIMAAGLLIVLLVGFSPVAAPASGSCLSPAAIAFSNSVIPAVVGAWQCPPYYKFDSNKKCCVCQKNKCKKIKKGECRCPSAKRWHAGKHRCVKR